MYVTAIDFAERPGARELAQVASAEHQRMVSYELMEATLRGTSRASFPVEDVAAADQALARIMDAAAEASSLIDGYLARRGYALPLNPVPELVTGWARAIARYRLHQHRGGKEDSDPIVRDYRDAVKFLELTANGKFSLGAHDPVQQSAVAFDVAFEAQPNVFSRDQLRSFR